MSLPNSKVFSTLNNTAKDEVLSTLFEDCSSFNDLIKENIKSIDSYLDLIERCRQLLNGILEDYIKDPTELKKKFICEIVSTHPRLGVPSTTGLSKYSKNEQKSLSDDNTELKEKLISLNSLYERTFPGLIFVVFVNGRSRQQIMEIMNDRIQNSTWLNEVKIAFNEMCEIAIDRSNKLGMAKL